ncbi:low molecular weight phosphatase family protein [Ascidiimonas sp. W6]|uniref:arsenate-mycothiol transferase ArsC n=1 Tax=Ascidiimonas meishanensis TaxID=3128903 RepID=UPI0030EF2B48
MQLKNNHILFFCTGNYYRSRFAELYFNHLASAQDLTIRAYSKGLRPSPNNEGPISPHTKKYLETQGLEIPIPKWPEITNIEDFEAPAKVIAMDREEHEPMMKNSFPQYQERIEYWSFADDYITEPKIILPALQLKVDEFFEQFLVHSK